MSAMSLPSILYFVILAIRDIKMTSIYFSQVKKVTSRIECVIGFFQNQYGNSNHVLAERDKGKSSQATERTWHLGWSLKVKSG